MTDAKSMSVQIIPPPILNRFPTISHICPTQIGSTYSLGLEIKPATMQMQYIYIITIQPTLTTCFAAT